MGRRHGGYDLATALWAAPRLADIGMDVLEQPLPANRLTGYRDLKRQGALPILMDEGVVSSAELIEFIRLDLLDGVAMKPARTAGLWDARRQVEILRDAGLLFLGSGLTDPDVALAARCSVRGLSVGFPGGAQRPQFLKGSFLRDPLTVEAGEMIVPAGQGLGVEVDEEQVPGGKDMNRLWILALLASSACAPSPFAFDDITPRPSNSARTAADLRLQPRRHVERGAPADRNRCCYVHPLYAPNGVMLTDDFPVDHYHHRGVFWVWPIVNVDGERRDLWLMNASASASAEWIAKETGEKDGAAGL